MVRSWSRPPTAACRSRSACRAAPREQSLEYANDGKAAGAQYVMALPPLGYRADADEVVAFYAELATCGLPVMAYNNPEASGVDLPAALVARIYDEVEGVVAVKECSGDTRRIPALLHLDGDLEVIVGGDDWALEGFAAGAGGWITGVGVLAPREMRRALRRRPRQ